ncbi:MAG: hypothetical protein ACLFQS_05845, partial [Bacteroidales bacterium]
YYRHDRKLLRITADFQRNISNDWKWLAGAGFFGVQTGPVDVDKLNEDLDPEDEGFCLMPASTTIMLTQVLFPKTWMKEATLPF